jgi:hypothetical protein
VERLGGRPVLGLLETQRPDGRRQHERRVAERGQGDERRAIGEEVCGLAGGPQGQARLAYPAGPRQGEQPGPLAFQEAPDLGELPAPPQ